MRFVHNASIIARLAVRGRLARAVRRGPLPSDQDAATCALLGWLRQAFVAGGGDAAAASYTMVGNWTAPYPEITGYCIPTLLEYAARTHDQSLLDLAHRAGQWLARTRLPGGAICRKQWHPGNTTPSVFNTGQVLEGWCALAEQDGAHPLWRGLARDAAEWLLAEQEPDGTWKRHAYNGLAHTYYARVAAPLAAAAALLGDARYADAARRHVEWVLKQQDADGWFHRAGFAKSEAPTTHTIAYVLEGVLRTGTLLDEPRYMESAERAARALRRTFERRGSLPGQFDTGWRPAADWRCITGDAQVGLVWARLAHLTDDTAYHEAAVQIADQVRRAIELRPDWPQISGALPGSLPRSGDYDRYAYPTHAAKFALDLLAALAPASATAIMNPATAVSAARRRSA
jgi:Squalene-hopene cyclase C-terminal domain